MGELERSLTHREFLEWHAFHEIHPFGLLHDDARLAVLTTVVANMLRSDKVDPVAPWQLMPWIGKPIEEKPKHEPTPDEVAKNVLAAFFSRPNNAPQPQLPPE